MDEKQIAFLSVLKAALRGEKCTLDHAWPILETAEIHHILPMIADALYTEEAPKIAAAARARALTIAQAQRTADFLLLLREMERRGLRPAVVKGLVCRSLYPKPELRPSVDEDLLIRPEEMNACCAAMRELGYSSEKEDTMAESDYEIIFRHPERSLLIEVHTALLPEKSEAYGDCARFFAESLDHTVERTILGFSVRTLSPTDHLLFLLCHAYKHFLHGGVGIRQICDMALMAEHDGEAMDWETIRKACDELHIAGLAAAMFRIAERRLGFSMPSAFAEPDVNESDLLEDVLSGGLYGVSDIDRAHSSTMTLEAVTSDRKGKRPKGALHSVFLPYESMKGRYPYLNKHPWLLPYAWIQRVGQYMAKRKGSVPVDPSRSIRIANERIQLLKEYQVIE